jgi:hypothetical protein
MNVTRTIFLALIAVHGFLIIWALVGFIEWFWPAPPWPRVSNPLFPREILFLQWSLTLVAGTVFIAGYLRAWRNLPVALACVYAAMAALCAVETFRYMESDSRFLAMILEYVVYAAILTFLFLSRTKPAFS